MGFYTGVRQCVDCGRNLRPADASKEDWPGTIAEAPGGHSRCWTDRKKFFDAKAAQRVREVRAAAPVRELSEGDYRVLRLIDARCKTGEERDQVLGMLGFTGVQYQCQTDLESSFNYRTFREERVG